MKKVVKLTESDLVKLVKRVLSEDEDESLMDDSSNLSYHQMRERDVTIKQIELSTILSIAYRWCRGKDNLPDCQRVKELYLKHYL
jgi:hypothetical protein